MAIDSFEFEVVQRPFQPPPDAPCLRGFLVIDNWDDKGSFSTLFDLVVYDEKRERHDIGQVKIGQFRMQQSQRRPAVSRRFERLDDLFFSLGQDDTYYAAIRDLGDDLRLTILLALRDVAFDLALFERAQVEKVMRVSLLRSVSPDTVRRQYSRLAHGGVRLSPFDVAFEISGPDKQQRLRLTFAVQPNSYPPSNIHVLIGRNGAGKTYLMNRMALASTGKAPHGGEFGTFFTVGEDFPRFTNVISVAFSAFDHPFHFERPKNSAVKHSHVGIRRSVKGRPTPAAKGVFAMAKEFAASLRECSMGARSHRWHRAITGLESDPGFLDANVLSLLSLSPKDKRFVRQASALFRSLSSGHKIVLLAITRLVELVDEGTLILIDEPESHLHPPLLAAFVRCLSDLLLDRNGLAIVATHSPVVVQEVPRHCVWKLRRFGTITNAQRPEIETFGENVSVLTAEVFGLEVTHSGFHRMLKDAVESHNNYSEALAYFNGELGGEAKAILRALLTERLAPGENQ